MADPTFYMYILASLPYMIIGVGDVTPFCREFPQWNFPYDQIRLPRNEGAEHEFVSCMSWRSFRTMYAHVGCEDGGAEHSASTSLIEPVVPHPASQAVRTTKQGIPDAPWPVQGRPCVRVLLPKNADNNDEEVAHDDEGKILPKHADSAAKKMIDAGEKVIYWQGGGVAPRGRVSGAARKGGASVTRRGNGQTRTKVILTKNEEANGGKAAPKAPAGKGMAEDDGTMQLCRGYAGRLGSQYELTKPKYMDACITPRHDGQKYTEVILAQNEGDTTGNRARKDKGVIRNADEEMLRDDAVFKPDQGDEWRPSPCRRTMGANANEGDTAVTADEITCFMQRKRRRSPSPRRRRRERVARDNERTRQERNNAWTARPARDRVTTETCSTKALMAPWQRRHGGGRPSGPSRPSTAPIRQRGLPYLTYHLLETDRQMWSGGRKYLDCRTLWEITTEY